MNYSRMHNIKEEMTTCQIWHTLRCNFKFVTATDKRSQPIYLLLDNRLTVSITAEVLADYIHTLVKSLSSTSSGAICEYAVNGDNRADIKATIEKK